MKLRREHGYEGLLTEDPVLRAYRFCNVFREDDRTTVWFREQLRDPLRDKPMEVLLATVVFRWFNRVETGERLKPMLLQGLFVADEVRAQLRDVKPVVTGAYMIKTPANMTKLEGIIHCVDWFLRSDVPDLIWRSVLVGGQLTLEDCWTYLMNTPYLGQFMAYEVVTDLRHTRILERAPDIMTWANPGPGAARGLSWLVAGTPKFFDRNKAGDRAQMLAEMRALLDMSTRPQYWPSDWPRWEMREVEHWLCEYDKWCRATYNGQSLKRRYP